MINIIIGVISVILFFCIYLLINLNKYIEKLERDFLKQIEKTENLHQSLKDIISEDALENDGRLKKFRIQKERNFIYNGSKAQEDTHEF